MDTLLSTLSTSVLITAAILAVTTFLTAIYLISKKLALPFGALLLDTIVSSHDNKPPPTSKQEQDTLRAQKTLASVVAIVLLIVCVLYEQIQAGSNYRPLGFNEFCGLAAKGCVEGVLVLAMLRSVLEGYRRLISRR
ncbi:unnamed protein product [Aureobasidium uvarum]|uniref:Uncharacterized protein n=1 Tax=Aureobasidium uvarum TaxID=2773716 RepID=A0A9N8PPS9_9PEZI|nr:unnamed protein product [Aureobasidium uvarum]